MGRTSTGFRRAAIGGSLLLLAVLIAVVALDGADQGGDSADDGAKRGGPEPTVVYDADTHGAVLGRGQLLMGVDADGKVRWKVRLAGGDLFPYAVCTQTCPRAELVSARDGAPLPERPDGPRLRFDPPGWRPVEARPRLRADRPLLPGPVPLRVTVARATGGASLTLVGEKARRLSDASPVPALSANRRVGVLLSRQKSRQQALVLRQRANGWALTRVVAVDPPANSVCVSADGSRIGLAGGGLPRVIEANGGRGDTPTTALGARRVELNAGACALGRSTFATAVMSTGGAEGGPSVVLTLHAGRRVRTASFTGSPGGLWVSERTGTAAILVEGNLTLIGTDGRRRVWRGVDAASVIGAGRLQIIPRRGKAYSRPF